VEALAAGAVEETLPVAAAVVETLATGAVEETLAAAYMEADAEAEALAAATVEAAVEALAAAAMVPWRSLWRRGEERMGLEPDIFRSRFLRMLIYHVPMNLAICYTGHGAAAV
jgi:hypothetical protein